MVEFGVDFWHVIAQGTQYLKSSLGFRSLGLGNERTRVNITSEAGCSSNSVVDLVLCLGGIGFDLRGSHCSRPFRTVIYCTSIFIAGT